MNRLPQVRLKIDTHRILKIEAAKSGRSLESLVDEAIRKYVKDLGFTE